MSNQNATLPSLSNPVSEGETPWWKSIAGIFKDEPLFDSVMQTIEDNSEREREEANRLADDAERRENLIVVTVQKAS